MVMGPERFGPKIDSNVNYRPVLLSQRELHFTIKKSAYREKRRKNLVRDPKGGPDTKTY
jgi:hypothetical protein